MASKHYRNCKLEKKPGEEYEFFLRDDDVRKGNIIVSVTAKGPADRAGLKNGDRVIVINGTNVEKKTHKEVVQLIKESGTEIMFQVVDEENDPNTPPPKTKGNIAPTKSDLMPRLCHVKKKKDTFGFSLEAQGSDKPGHFISEVADGGPAKEVGIRKGDRIIEVGGTNVEKLNHAKLVALIKKKGSKVTLLVVDDETHQHYLKKKTKIKAKHASVSSVEAVNTSSAPPKSKKASKSSKKSTPRSTSSLPFSKDEKARLVHVIKASGKGYGFFLRVKKEEKGEYIGDVKPGTPGDRCGLKEDDRVLSVNGKGILFKTHEEVVDIIKANPNHAILLVVGPSAIENAKNNGLLSALRDAKEHIIEKPRVIFLEKGDGGYGFSLKMDTKAKNGHVFTDIEGDTPSSRGGIKDGDVLGCVNGKDVTKVEHDDTVKMIKDSGEDVELTVGCKATMDLLRDLEIEVTKELLDSWPDSDLFKMPDFSDADDFFKVVMAAAAISTVAEKVAEQRENTVKCTLKKVDNAFGFFLRDDSGHFLGNIEADGAAERAGVKDGDQIIEVNGVNVEKKSHDKLVEMIRDSGDQVVFLVLRNGVKEVSEKKEEHPIAAVVIESEPEEDPKHPLPRFCEVERLPNGYGFNLNAEEGSRPGQYMKRIVAGGAASIAGVKEGDRVIEINDVSIAGKSHDDVVGLIKNSGSKFTVLVVDEEADLYYKNIEITKALLTGEDPIPFFEQRNPEDDSLVYKGVLKEMAVLSTAPGSSVVEATVHVDPDDEPDKSSPPILVMPPPPSYEEQKEEEDGVADLIEEAIEENQKEREAELEEIAEKVKQEAAVEIIVDEVKEDLKEELQEEIREAVQEEIAEEIAEEIKEEIKEEMREEIIEKMKEDALEEMREEAVEELKEEVREDIREEVIEEMKEEVIEEMREEAMEEIKEEIMDEVREEIIDDVRENVATGIKVAAAMAVVNKIQEAAEDEREEQRREELKEEIVEEIRESPEEMRERIEREMREKLEREMKEKIEEEIRQKMAAQAAPPPPPAPEPPKFVPVSVIASSYGREIRPSVKKPAQSFVPKVEATVNSEDLSKIARNLRSVKKVKDFPVDLSKEEPKEEQTSKPNFSSAKAMFEGGSKASGPKPAWQRSVKQTGGVYGTPKPAVNGNDNLVTGRQTSWKSGGMSFKIVETSATFN